MGSVREHHAVEAQLPAEQAAYQLRGQRGWHDIVVGYSRVEMPCVSGLHDVPRHDGLQAVVDQVPVHFAESGVPLLTAEIIHAVGHMLVAEIQPVSGEMLGGTAKAGIGMGPVHVGLRHLHDPVRIVPVCPQADDRVLPVVQDVADRGKREVAANRRGFFVGHMAQVVGVLHIPGGAYLSLAADGGAVHTGAVPAVLRVAGDDQGNLAVLLEDAVLFLHLGSRGGIVADAADVVFLHRHLQIFLVPAGAHVEEKLPDLLVQGHARDCLLHPFTVLVGQIKGLRFHVDHNFVLYFPLFRLKVISIQCHFRVSIFSSYPFVPQACSKKARLHIPTPPKAFRP